MKVLRSDDEIDALELAAGHDGNSKWSGRSYEDGILATIEWLFIDFEIESPMAED